MKWMIRFAVMCTCFNFWDDQCFRCVKSNQPSDKCCSKNLKHMFLPSTNSYIRAKIFKNTYIPFAHQRWFFVVTCYFINSLYYFFYNKFQALFAQCHLNVLQRHPKEEFGAMNEILMMPQTYWVKGFAWMTSMWRQLKKLRKKKLQIAFDWTIGIGSITW